MALIIAQVPDGEDVTSKFRRVLKDVTFDNAYVAGGMAVAPAAVGLTVIQGAKIWGGNPAAAGLRCHWDTTNKKLMLTYPTGSTIAAPAAIADPILNAGAVAVVASAAGGPIAAGRGKELAAGTDASSITVRVEFIGQ